MICRKERSFSLIFHWLCLHCDLEKTTKVSCWSVVCFSPHFIEVHIWNSHKTQTYFAPIPRRCAAICRSVHFLGIPRKCCTIGRKSKLLESAKSLDTISSSSHTTHTCFTSIENVLCSSSIFCTTVTPWRLSANTVSLQEISTKFQYCIFCNYHYNFTSNISHKQCTYSTRTCTSNSLFHLVITRIWAASNAVTLTMLLTQAILLPVLTIQKHWQHSRKPGKALHKQNEPVCGRYMHKSYNVSNEVVILKST